jgi:hypothetical protein
MPSPFPGMDPFIESQCWRDFHTAFITVVRDALIEQLRPRYVVHVEEYVYFTDDSDQSLGLAAPDVRVAETEESWRSSEGSTATAVTARPAVHELPLPERIEQTYLEIRSDRPRKLVTVLEILSPTNKRPGPGQQQYLQKRANVLHSMVNLVELDLLRCGARLPTVPPLQADGHYALVTRHAEPTLVDVYGWTLRDTLPTIPVPLAAGDDDATLPLQELFTSMYDRAGYDYSLDYDAPLDPALNQADQRWVRQMLNAARAPAS